MQVLSIEFFIFFMVFYLLYLQGKWQNQLLTFASIAVLAYSSFYFATVVLLFSLIIHLHSCLLVTYKQNKKVLISGVIFSIFFLSIFKYFDFFKEVLMTFGLDESFELLMPIGISYYVFQSIAYLTSLYRDPLLKLNFWQTLAHFSFFTTITSGPIIRAESFKTKFGMQQGFVEQIRNDKKTIIAPALALSLITLGILKKWVFAGDIANIIVDPVFENPQQYHFFDILAAIYGYTFQLFFDFSGYSDLVIGIALLLGFRLPLNFNMPLRAVNIGDFWDRWHISLSTWIRDYIYIPLGGNRNGFVKAQIYIILAFLFSGIWHGAGWNFALWGLLHGIGLAFLNIIAHIRGEKILLSDKGIMGKILSIFITFNFIAFSFLVFKINDFSELILILTALFSNTNQGDLSFYAVLFLGLSVIMIVCYPLFDELFNMFVRFLEKRHYIEWFVIFIFIFIIIIELAPSGMPNFIYANF